MLNKFIRRFDFILFALLLVVIPSIKFDNIAEPTITSKYLIFLLVIPIIGLIKSFKVKKSLMISFTKMDLALIIFVIYITVNRFVIQDTYHYSVRYNTLLLLLLTYFLVKIFSHKKQLALLFVIVVSGIIQAVYGRLQVVDLIDNASSRLTGTFFNPGLYAGFLSFTVVLSMLVYYFRKELINILNLKKYQEKAPVYIKYLVLVNIVTCSMLLLNLKSRASYFVIIVCLLLLSYQYLNSKFSVNHKFKRFSVIGLLTVIPVTGILLYFLKKDSADGRLLIWKVSSKIISDFPLFGVGFDRFKANYMNYQAAYFSQSRSLDEVFLADNSMYAFNEVIQVLVENGFIGLVILGWICFQVIKTKSNIKYTALLNLSKIALVSIAAFALFSYPSHVLPIKLIVIVLLAIISSVSVDSQEIGVENKALKPAGVSAFFVLAVFSSTLSVSLYKSYQIWNNADMNYSYRNYSVSSQLYESLYPRFHNEGKFLMNYGKSLLLEKRYQKSEQIFLQAANHLSNDLIPISLGEIYSKQKDIPKAEKEYVLASHMIPVKFYPKYLLAKMYIDNNQKDKATVIAHEILEKEIKINSQAIDQMKAEMKAFLKNNLREVN